MLQQALTLALHSHMAIYTVGPPYTYHAPSPPALSLQKKEDEMAHHGMSHQW